MQVSTQASSAGAADSDECAFAFKCESIKFHLEVSKSAKKGLGFVLRRGDRTGRLGLHTDGLHEHEQGHEARKGSDVDVGRSAGGSGCGTWYMQSRKICKRRSGSGGRR